MGRVIAYAHLVMDILDDGAVIMTASAAGITNQTDVFQQALGALGRILLYRFHPALVHRRLLRKDIRNLLHPVTVLSCVEIPIAL